MIAASAALSAGLVAGLAAADAASDRKPDLAASRNDPPAAKLLSVKPGPSEPAATQPPPTACTATAWPSQPAGCAANGRSVRVIALTGR